MRRSECEDVGLEISNKAALEDVGQNADLYIANQEDNAYNSAPSQCWFLINVQQWSRMTFKYHVVIALILVVVVAMF